MIKAIFIDMDDTLIVNAVLYEKSQAMLEGYLSHFGVRSDEFDKVFHEVETKNYPVHGYSRERFPLSFEMTLKHFIPNADDDMVKTVRDFAEKVFQTVAALKPGTLEAIDLLNDHYPVYLVTQGDKGVQQFRVDHLPFREEFEGVYIVEKKSKETYAKIADELGIPRDQIVMMGDSLKSDVVPAVEAGLKAVWIEAHNWVAMENAPQLPKENAWRFTSLLEAARHIVTHDTPAAPMPVLPAPRRPKNNFPKP